MGKALNMLMCVHMLNTGRVFMCQCIWQVGIERASLFVCYLVLLTSSLKM